MSQPDHMSILWGEVHWNHIGPHSGLRPLLRHMETANPGRIERLSTARPQPGVLEVATRKVRNLLRPYPEWAAIRDSASPLYSPESWQLEVELERAVARSRPDVLVLEGIEEHYFKLAAARPRWGRTRVVGISHQTPAWLRLRFRKPELAKSLDALIVFSTAAQAFWAPIVGEHKTHFIPHGVETDFFRPPSTARPRRPGAPLRALFCGHWLRDFDTLAEAVEQAASARLNVVFDAVVPHKARDTEACYRVAMSPLVRWHAALSDETLRDLYAEADVVVLPLLDATANNAVLEAIACGRPLIVTDVGGTRDYATEAFADFVPPRDSAAVVRLLEEYAARPETLVSRGEAARRHAEDRLSWAASAARFQQVVHAIARQERP